MWLFRFATMMPVIRNAMLFRAVLCSALLLSAPLSLAADESTSDNEESVRSTTVVYVESNIGTPDGNSILAFKRTAHGTLTPLPESPFPTRGKGLFDLSLELGPFDSDQNIVTNPERTLLFAVNSGSNTIAAFHIRADGSLMHVEGSPFPSGGVNPVSVGLSRDTLVVVNKAMDPDQPTNQLPNYASFRVSPDGKLEPMPLSDISVAAGNSPTQALVSPSLRLVFGADFLGGLLQSFVVEPAGELRQNQPQALPESEFAGSNAPRLPLGLTAHPHRPIVYVGFVTVNKLGVYTYDAFGRLGFVRTVPNSGQAICWLRPNFEGTRLYTSNTGDNSISVYDTSDPLRPVEIQQLTLSGIGSAFQLELDPEGRFLYVVTQRATPEVPLGQGNTLHVLRIRHNGTLSEPHRPLQLSLPSGTRPQGLATFALKGERTSPTP